MIDQLESHKPKQSPNFVKKSKTKNGRKMSTNIQQLKDGMKVELKKAKSSKSDSSDEKFGKIGSSRGVESMFRSSYRAQLDMIALAATKANIMISLNGLLVSMLLLSGAYFISAEPLVLIPVTLLLLTCTVAIVFAVLAARPDVDNRPQSLEDFKNDKADILIFEQFSKLSPEEFDTAMWDMLGNHERVYHSMIAHIYDMGCIADKKFARLNVSYNSFMVGIIISVLSLIVVMGYYVFAK